MASGQVQHVRRSWNYDARKKYIVFFESEAFRFTKFYLYFEVSSVLFLASDLFYSRRKIERKFLYESNFSFFLQNDEAALDGFV